MRHVCKKQKDGINCKINKSFGRTFGRQVVRGDYEEEDEGKIRSRSLKKKEVIVDGAQ